VLPIIRTTNTNLKNKINTMHETKISEEHVNKNDVTECLYSECVKMQSLHETDLE